MDSNDFNNDDYRDPEYWKWGIFYFNKKDKRLLLPKRNPYFGWTVNFANPFFILFLLVLTAVLVFAGKHGC